jgi:hypothetical protein
MAGCRDDGAATGLAGVGMSGMRGRGWRRLFLLALAACSAFLFLRQGWLPSPVNPLPAIDLAIPRPWFTDWRLAAIRHEPALCRQVMREPIVAAQPIADAAAKDGCGHANAIRITRAGGARITADRMTCELGAALALWIEHEVQPAALVILGQRVIGIGHMGTYACRNIIGRRYLPPIRSQHASANAIDISAFTLADGRQISVKQHWSGRSRESDFLREVHERACPYFRAVLGPQFNADHADHFHLDRGLIRRCR